MTIITVPHPTLRQVAQPVTEVTTELTTLVTNLGQTLKSKRNPQGVGLAAPQVDQPQQLFATYLPTTINGHEAPAKIRIFINPQLIDHSDTLTLGPDKKRPLLEGCLSIPRLYGPVPRWQVASYSFQELVGDELVSHTETFTDFAARVMQHEFDHLQGTLFTDYSLQYDLPVYHEDEKSGQLEEIDNYSILEIF